MVADHQGREDQGGVTGSNVGFWPPFPVRDVAQVRQVLGVHLSWVVRCRPVSFDPDRAEIWTAALPAWFYPSRAGVNRRVTNGYHVTRVASLAMGKKKALPDFTGYWQRHQVK